MNEKTNSREDASTTESDINYTDEQSEILAESPGYSRILAPAGGGKSTTLTAVVGRVTGLEVPEEGSPPADPIPPDRILIVLFSEDDERSMRKKLQQRYGTEGTMPTVKNYNSLGEYLRQEYKFMGRGSPDSQLCDGPERDCLIADIAAGLSSDIPDGIPELPAELPADDRETDDRKKRLKELIDLAKTKGHTPADFASVLPDRERLVDAAAIFDKLINGAPFNPEADALSKSPEKALKATRSSIAEVQQEARDVATGGGSSRFERLLTASLKQVCELCAQQRSFLSQYARDDTDDRVRKDVLKLTRQFMSTVRAGDEYRAHADSDMADSGVCRIPLQSAWWTVRAIWWATELQSGYATYQEHLRSMDPPRHDYSDQVSHTNELLEANESILEREANKYDLVLADEFQDTAPDDFSLISSFGQYLPIIAVGDTAQQIYNFRGTVQELFNERFADVFDPADYKLSQNFRTYNQDLLDVVNSLGGRIDSFSEITSWHTEQGEVPPALDDVPPIQYTNLKYDKHTNETDTVDLVMDRIDAVLEGELPSLETDCPRIAVGLRRRYLSSQFREALEEGDYDYQLLTEASQELPMSLRLRLDALRVATDTADEEAVRRLLTTGAGIDAAVLDDLADGEVLQSFLTASASSLPSAAARAQDKISAIQSVAHRQSLSTLLNTCVEEFDLSSPEKSHHQELCDALDEILSERPDNDVFDVDTRLDVITEEIRNASSGSVADPDIVLGTVHKLKGREADLVIAPRLHPFPYWGPRRSPFDVLQYAQAKAPDEMESVLATDFVSRADQEQRRVLHVLLTRARAQLHIIGDDPSWCDELEVNSASYPLREYLPEGFDYTDPPEFNPYQELRDACQDLDIWESWSSGGTHKNGDDAR